MPIYEYRCNTCLRPFSLLVRSFSSEVVPVCPRCGGSDARRLISRFAVLRSEDNLSDSTDDMMAGLGDVDENDPRSIARWARKMSGELGEDAGPEFNEMVDRLEAGESPESIEQSLGGEDDMGGLDGMDGLGDAASPMGLGGEDF